MRRPNISPELKLQRVVLKERQERSDFAAVLSTPQGRRFVWSLIHERCKRDQDVFAGNSGDAHRAGRRSVGLDLLKEAKEQHTALYQRMHDEDLGQFIKQQTQRQADASDGEDDDDHASRTG